MGQFGNYIYDGGNQTLTPEKSDSTVFDDMPLQKFASIVNKTALSNSDLQAEALSKADSYSFQVAHPELERTVKNNKLINHWLTSQRITHPLYPDLQAAVDALTVENLLDIDGAELAKQQDQRGNRTYKGTLTGREFDSLQEMIGIERQAALNKAPEATKDEQAFERLPIEEQKRLLREGERGEQLKVNGLKTWKNGDAWITLHPEYVDSEHNARLIKMQLAANGASDNNASIQDYEVAGKQLIEAGLLTLKQTAVTNQHAAEVAQLASQAVKTPGTVFDNTSEEEMYNLPMEELEKRARGWK
jgi:hypothetical protein